MMELWQCILLITLGAMLVGLIIIGLAIIRCRRTKKASSNFNWGRMAGPYFIQDSLTVSMPPIPPYNYFNELSSDSYDSL